MTGKTATQVHTECQYDCGSPACRMTTANCRTCKTRGEFHVSLGEIQPIEYWECENCGAVYENVLMTPEQVYREARRGFVYAP